MTQFFNHESEGEITNIKDTNELKNWISHLEYIKTELQYLVALIKKQSNNGELIKILEQQQQENNNELSSLYNYAPSISESQECDDVDCDIFFLNKHEEFRNKYLEYLGNYRKIKNKIFEALLN
ncbi:MAG TPA: hypothetical protein VK050_04155 [Flavobacteriaceae bacterium]|nr:hypothetical protein [Flavobacteriaceae bacterium]